MRPSWYSKLATELLEGCRTQAELLGYGVERQREVARKHLLSEGTFCIPSSAPAPANTIPDESSHRTHVW
jgi:hypothetical protein